ncbi:PH domain-containing protein [Agromyces protaetiae]|uniref:PH domain-containing protein n=1 Tax=Agromyces protaetiae TaxID=2509455 RepID=UPI001AA01F4B|nr:PH domain-containing protein [Agromyces protaetiae]
MRLFDPNVRKHLITDEGEVVVDEVTKHWTASLKPFLEIALAVPVLALLFWLPRDFYWVPLLGAPILVLHALWRIAEVRMDRFVITNMRVFRVHGILSQQISTMPLARILDISVRKPVIGRILGYGHFVFESAAQDQGLREIRFVGRPDQRDLTIQRVIARAGLRGAGAQQGVPARYPDSERMPRADDGWMHLRETRETERIGDAWWTEREERYDRDEARFVPVQDVSGSHPEHPTEPIATIDPERPAHA